MKLVHETILITGGASGIGFELARRLIERGNHVYPFVHAIPAKTA